METGYICDLVLVVEAEVKGGSGKRPNVIGDKELFEWADTVGKRMTQ